MRSSSSFAGSPLHGERDAPAIHSWRDSAYLHRPCWKLCSAPWAMISRPVSRADPVVLKRCGKRSNGGTGTMGKKDGFNRAASIESIIASFRHRRQNRHRNRNKTSQGHPNNDLTSVRAVVSSPPRCALYCWVCDEPIVKTREIPVWPLRFSPALEARCPC